MTDKELIAADLINFFERWADDIIRSSGHSADADMIRHAADLMETQAAEVSRLSARVRELEGGLELAGETFAEIAIEGTVLHDGETHQNRQAIMANKARPFIRSLLQDEGGQTVASHNLVCGDADRGAATGQVKPTRPACSCWTCTKAWAEGLPFQEQMIAMGRMFCCETCGNKRCPHATHHVLACTASNAPGQAGSNYA